MPLDELERALTPEQLKLFSVPTTENCLVVAGAGSGKTRVLTHFLVNEISRGLDPAKVIAFTFTEKAATEMLHRIRELANRFIPEVSLQGMFIGTIHSWCLNYLHSTPEYLNVASADELHSSTLSNRLYDSIGIATAYSATYPRGLQEFNRDLEVANNEGGKVESFLPSAVLGSIQKFREATRSNKILTFGDLIILAKQQLMKSDSFEARLVLVDEYQDVNPAQVELIQQIASVGARVIAVGDPLQCIYQWRGSDLSRTKTFCADFAPAQVIELRDNYRSRPSIVDFANSIVVNDIPSSSRAPMIAMKNRSHPLEVVSLSSNGASGQASDLGDLVLNCINSGVKPEQIAVLMRSIRSSARPIIDELTARGVPVSCPLLIRGELFIENFILPIFNWLRAPQVDPRTPAEEEANYTKAKDLWQTVSRYCKQANYETFWLTLGEWHTLVHQSKSQAYDVRGRLYDFLSSLDIVVSNRDSDVLAGLSIASQIIRSVEEIHRRRIKGQSRRTAAGVVNEVFFALMQNYQDFGESQPIDLLQKGVVVSTVHQAKGLEWPFVFVVNLRNGSFPVRNSSFKSSFPPSVTARYGTSLEDEARLFYVACTRAVERLILLDPCAEEPKRRSGFLRSKGLQTFTNPRELPADLWAISGQAIYHVADAPLIISASDLLMYQDCPYQFALRRIARLQPAIGDELGFGQSLHEIIQRRILSGRDWTIAEFITECEAHVHLPYMSESAELEAKRAIAQRVFSLQNLGALQEVVATEYPVEWDTGHGIINGTVDAIVQEAERGWIIRDWKASLDERFVSRYSYQVQIYAAALGYAGKTVSGGDLIDISATYRSGRLEKVGVDIDVSKLDRFTQLIVTDLASLDGGNFQPTPTDDNCSRCDVSKICAHRSTK